MAILNNAIVNGSLRCLNKAWFSNDLEVSGSTVLQALTATTGTFTGALTGTSASFTGTVAVTGANGQFEGKLKNSLTLNTLNSSGQPTPVLTYNNSQAATLTIQASDFGGADANDAVYWVQGGGESAGDWVGVTDPDTLELQHGMKILYIVGAPGSADEEIRGEGTDNERNFTALSLNESDYIPCYYANYRSGVVIRQKRLKDEYQVGEVIQMIYHYDLTEPGIDPNTYKGWWQVLADYDSNDPNYRTKELNAQYIAGNAITAYKLCAVGADGKLYTISTGTNSSDVGYANFSPLTTPFYPSQIYYYEVDDNSSVTANNPVPKGSLYSQVGDYNKIMYTFSQPFPINSQIYLKGSYDAVSGLFTLDNSGSTGWYAFRRTIKSLNDGSVTTYHTNFVNGSYYILIAATGDVDAIEDDEVSYGDYLTYRANLFSQHPLYCCTVDNGEYKLSEVAGTASIANQLSSGTVGATNKPIYFNNGVPAVLKDSSNNDITIGKSVPTNAVFTDQKTSSGSSTSSLFVLGAASQTTSGVTTYSATNVRVTGGDTLYTKKVKIGTNPASASAAACTLQYNATDNTLDFIFS